MSLVGPMRAESTPKCKVVQSGGMAVALHGKQIRAIELFASNQFGTKEKPALEKREIAERVGVRPETVWRWEQIPEFTQTLEAAKQAWLEAWRQETRHLYLSHRRGRLEELHRIYYKIPDSYLASETRSGMKIERLNVDAQVKVLELIGQEMAADVVQELEELKIEIAAITSVPFQVQG